MPHPIRHGFVFPSVLLTAALLLTACGGSSDTAVPDERLDIAPPPPIETQTFAGSDTAGEIREITWDELMPAGEDEQLAEMYEAFYLDLDRKLRGSQMQLNAPGSQMSAADLEEGGAFDVMPQLGTYKTVPELNGQKVRIPAYITPLDFTATSEHREFLLVPYFGACIHSPPPPPNQVIFVEADPPAHIANIWGAVWAEGVLRAERQDSDIGNAAYTLQLTKLEPYEN